MNEFTLSNGMRVLHKEIGENPLVSVEFFLRGGTILEKANQAGLAHFTQIMLLQGTKDRNAEQISQEIEDIGANIQSDIEHDYATLGLSLMDRHFDKAMSILSDLVTHPSFPDAEIEKERHNILANLRSRKDSIFNVTNDLFNTTFYGSFPYAWPDTGREDTVKRFTRKDLVRWHAEHFAADSMLLVITGNVPLDKAKEAAERHFGKIPRGKRAAAFPQAAAPKALRVSEKSPKFEQAMLMIGFPAPALTGKEFPVLKVINALLGGRMSGRLFVELREKLSLGYEVSSFYPSRREMSRFVVYLGLDAKNLELARKRIIELLDELKTTKVGLKELDETKTFIRGVYLLDHQTIGRQSWYLGWWDILGKGYAYDDRYLDDLMAVTPEDIQAAAQKIFTDTYVQVEVVPEKR